MQLPRIDNLAGVTPLPAATIAASKAGRGGDAFGRDLRTQLEKAAAPAQSRQEQVREAANQLVSVAFVKPLLAQIRKNPLRNDLFHGGMGEDTFQEHLDTLLADRVASRMNSSLADSIYKKFLGAQGSSQPAGGLDRAG